MRALGRACAGVAVVVTAYYQGTAVLRSADGKRELGRRAVLVMRVTDPAKNSIVETVVQAGKDGGPAEERVATLQRTGTAGDFTASDPERTWSGRMRFEGEGWKLDRWSYDLRFRDGSRLTGDGRLDDEGMKTNKLLHDSAGVPAVSITEDLRSVGADEYRSERARLLGGRR